MKTLRGCSEKGKNGKHAAAALAASKVRFHGSRVAVLMDQRMEERTAAGIVIPGQVKQRPNRGTCIALGQGVVKDPGKYNVEGLVISDRVVVSRYEGQEATILLPDGDKVVVDLYDARDVYCSWGYGVDDGGAETSGDTNPDTFIDTTRS